MSTLHINLLGNFHLRYGDERISSVNTARLQALFAYLLLHRQAPQSRQQIAFLFWPDSSEKQAHTNLRKLLFQLRNALPTPDAFLTQDHLTVQWRPDAPYTLDVAELQSMLARCLTADGKPVAQVQHDELLKATSLYQGALLPSCFDDWLLPLRQQLQHDVIRVIEQLIHLAEHQREYQAGIRYAQRLLGIDPLHEVAYRRVMQLHALNGERTAALHAYQTCAALLQRELGVEPDEETHALYQQLLTLENQPVQAVKPLFDTPLVGRRDEWQALVAAWRKAQRGATHFVSLAGEAGIGKTRLAEELLTWARAQGARVAHTRSYEAEGGLAYTPITDWLRSQPLKPAIKKLDKLWLSEVARLLPELFGEHPNLTPPAPLTETWQRQRFFEALARAFLIDKAPLLLVIDDLQWCDSETLTWLRFLLRFDPQARLLIVGTWRSEAVDNSHPLQTLLRDVDNAKQLTALELALLTAQHTAELAQTISPQPLAGSAMQQLYAVTEGHPLFVIETLRAIVNGDWRPETEDSYQQASVPDHQSLPPKVQHVIQARLAQLSSEAQALAALAATIGRRFSFAVLAHAGQSSEETLLAALDELVQRRIIREQGADIYDFSHDRIREVVYRGVSTARRRLLHRRVAEALEALYPNELNELSGELAAHYEQAVMVIQARKYWQRSGTWAAAQFANAEAIQHFSKALTLTPASETNVRFELLVQREAVYALVGQSEQRLADLLTIQQIGQQLLLQDTLQARPAIQSALLLGEYYQRAGRPAQTVVSLQTATALAQQYGEPVLEARAWASLGDALFHQGKLEGARDALLEAVRCASHEGLVDIEARAYEYLAAVSTFSGAQATLIEDYLHRALLRFQQTGTQLGIGRVLNKLGYLPVAQGERAHYARALDWYQQALQILREIGHQAGESNVLRNLGVLFTCTGDYRQASNMLHTALILDRQAQDFHSEGVALNYLAGVYLNMGNYAAAQTSLTAALNRLQKTNSNGWICKIWNDFSWLHLVQGEFALARENAEQAQKIAQTVGDRRQVAQALTRLGHAQTGLGDYHLATAAFNEAYTIHQELAQFNRSMEPLAGLARNFLRQQNLQQAFQQVESILAHLQNSPLDHTDEALQVYMTCYWVLHALNDQRASAWLAVASEQLQARAASLATEDERALFWSAPPHSAVLNAQQSRK